MLVLARKQGEAVVMTLRNGQEIRIVIHSIRNDVVRLAVEADRDVHVLREELIEREPKNERR